MNRTVIACLAVAAVCAASGAVFAQPADAPAAAPAPAPPPPPPPPPPPAPPEQPAMAQPVLPPEAPPMPQPTGEAAQVIAMMEKACLPLIAKTDAKSVTAALGLKKTRDGLVLQLQSPQKITVSPPTLANPDVCTLTINFDVDQSKPLVDALFVWAATQSPSLPPLSSAYQPNPSLISWSWAVDTGAFREGLVFSVQRTADGRPLGKNYDVATLLLSRNGG